MAEVGFGNDGDFSDKTMILKVNNNLANRRANLEKKQSKTPVYQEIADDAVRLMEKGWSDLAIARSELSVSVPASSG